MLSFTEMPLSAALQRRLTAAEFLIPTPVQAQAIPPALAGQDIIATAQTGTGKTLAFVIPIVERLGCDDSRELNALVLAPTRELAMQIEEQYDLVRGKLPKAAVIMGGVAEKPQIQALRSGARLVIATPGRLEDLLGRKLLSLRAIKVLVLDEADRMLDMGFLPSIRRIVGMLPQRRQTLCYSATLEASVAGLVHDCTINPVRVALGSTLKPATSVDLHAYEVLTGEKRNVLRALLTAESGRTLVFTRTKRATERLARDLIREGFAAAMIHGDRTQSQRCGALDGFQQGRFRVLVATDIAARGLHVDEVAHVINYDLPTVAEDFIHRVGRTGRAGARGLASSLVAGVEVIELRHIERTLQLRMERKQMKPDATAMTMPQQRNTLASRTLTALPGEVFA